MRRRVEAIVAPAELGTAAEIPRVHEFDDAPEIERAVLERRAGQSQPMTCPQRARGSTHDRVGILDGLGLVEDHGPQLAGPPCLEVAPQSRIGPALRPKFGTMA